MSFRLSMIHSVPEQHVHIVEPVAKQVLQFVIQKLGYLEFFREQGNIDLISEFTSTSKAVDRNGNPELHDNRVRAKLNWNLNPQAVKWQGNGTTIDLGNGNHLVTNAGAAPRQGWARATYSETNASVMSDVDAFTDIVEYSVGSTLTMEVQVDFKHNAHAFECFTRLFQCFQNGEMIGYVDVQYDYPIPYSMQTVYKYISSLMGEPDWPKRMVQCSGGNITTVQNRNNPGQQELVVKKNHFQAIYQLECSQEAPTPGDPDGAMFTFNINVQFARANRLMLKYPIIVNNQFVDFDYVPVDENLRASNGLVSPVMWRNHAVTEYWAKNYPNRRRPVHYPWWDDWDLPKESVQVMRGFHPIAIIAFCLDLTQDEHGNPVGETKIDLIHGLPGIKLNDDIIGELMCRTGRELLLPNRYINVAVFAEDYQLGTPSQIEDNIKPIVELEQGILTVRAVRPYTQYRLVISINPHPMNLTSRPVSAEVFPSRWYDVTAPSYINTKDSIVNTWKTYYCFDTVTGQYVQIPTTVNEPMSDVYARLAKCEELYELVNSEYVPTRDVLIIQDKSYYTYDIATASYRETPVPVGSRVTDLKERLAEAGCIYEYKDAVYGQDVIEDSNEYVGYEVCKDTRVQYDTDYFTHNSETGEFDKIEGLEFDQELPTDVTVYVLAKEGKKYYVNKTELNSMLSGRQIQLALSLTADNVALPVYEEVDIPAGTPVSEVKQTLGVSTLYMDNDKAAPKEPVRSITTSNKDYLESYNGYNASRVFQVTFYMRKRKP